MNNGRRTSILIVVAGIVAAEVAFRLLWPSLDDNDPVPGIESQLAVVAAIGLVVLPHVIGLLTRRRRWLYKVAGAVGIVLTLGSAIDPILLVIAVPVWLIPSIAYLLASREPEGTPRVPLVALVLGSIALTVGAVLSLFLTDDPRCTIVTEQDGKAVYEAQHPCNPSDSGRLGLDVIEWSGTDDTFALHESILSLVLTGGVVVLCWVGGAPREPLEGDTRAGTAPPPRTMAS